MEGIRSGVQIISRGRAPDVHRHLHCVDPWQELELLARRCVRELACRATEKELKCIELGAGWRRHIRIYSVG